jgi:transposase-like protein
MDTFVLLGRASLDGTISINPIAGRWKCPPFNNTFLKQIIYSISERKKKKESHN